MLRMKQKSIGGNFVLKNVLRALNFNSFVKLRVTIKSIYSKVMFMNLFNLFDLQKNVHQNRRSKLAIFFRRKKVLRRRF